MDIIYQARGWLEDPEIYRTDVGVCGNLGMAVGTHILIRFDEKLLKQLPNYSGFPAYPLGGGMEEYYERQRLDTIWSGEGMRTRHELIELLKTAEITKYCQDGKVSIIFKHA